MSIDVSEVCAASIIRAMIMEAARISETSVNIQLRTWQYIPEDSELQTRAVFSDLRYYTCLSQLFVYFTIIVPSIKLTFNNILPCQLSEYVARLEEIINAYTEM
jgi:hypothetical protein